MGEFVAFFVLSAVTLVITLLLRHFFNMKYPEVDSSYIILLPIAQTVCMFLYITCLYGVLMAASYDYFWGTNYVSSISDTEDTLLGVHTMFTIAGGAIMLVTVPLLLYHTFNFPKCKSKRLKILANVNTVCVLTADVSGIITYAFCSEIMLCIVFLMIFIGILFLQIKYPHFATSIYRNKHSDSIQSVVVKSLAQLAPEKKEETKRCPYCGEEILAVAKKCKYCGEWLDKETSLNN